MSKNTYWISDVDGTKAAVEGVAARDEWTKVHGWTEASEPVSTDLVWLEHETTGGKQRFAADAAPQWAGLGWHPSAPPAPADLTKDPLLVDQPPAEPVAGLSPAAKTTTSSAAAADKTKE